MEYGRINKVQSGIISPSKLRMKLMGIHNQKARDGSKSNSSRTSPSKLEDMEFVKNSLLDSNNGDYEEEVSSLENSSKLSSNTAVISNPCKPCDYGNTNHIKLQNHKGDTGNSSSVHPMRTLEDENLDYDSNASSSSFEFHKGDKLVHNSMQRSLLRPMSSKWNDAEKWIMNKQNYSKNNSSQSQVNRVNKLPVKAVNFSQPEPHIGLERFSFVPHESERVPSGEVDRANGLGDLCLQNKDFNEVNTMDLSTTTDSAEGVPSVRTISMRDMGTEMTPIPSQEPSRTPSPIGTTTPLSSIQSTPQRVAPANTPTENSDNGLQNGKREGLSEQDLKLKTRKEIVALGLQLGKTNIATWASKNDDKDKTIVNLRGEDVGIEEIEIQRVEFEKRAVAWEEAEKCRHNARFKREEIKIQAWESQQKAKLEAEVRRIEAQMEQMKAQAKAKMVKKIAMARQRSEEKRAAAEAKKNRLSENAAAQADYIRQTGRIPPSSPYTCGWFYNR